MLKRHEIEVLLKGGRAKIELVGLTGVSPSSIKLELEGEVAERVV